MKKRWRLETRPTTLGTAAGATWGPWKTTVEIHQVFCVVSTDATVANRVISLRHSLIAPVIGLGEMAMTSGISASKDSIRCTWGQGFNSTTVNVDSVSEVRTCFLPFAFIASVGESVSLTLYNVQAGDSIIAPVIMVRDLDDVEHGR